MCLILVLKPLRWILFPVSLKLNYLSDFRSSFSSIIVIVPSVHSDPFWSKCKTWVLSPQIISSVQHFKKRNIFLKTVFILQLVKNSAFAKSQMSVVCIVSILQELSLNQKFSHTLKKQLVAYPSPIWEVHTHYYNENLTNIVLHSHQCWYQELGHTASLRQSSR